jgi:cell division initiation protein
MDVSAQTLREVEFREKLRGYHPDDVDEFLERVAAGIEFLQDKLRQATERAQRAEARAADGTAGDDALKRTLVLAQRTAEMAVQEARQEADRIAAAARAEGNAVVAQAEELARRTIEDTQGGIRAELDQLEGARDRLRADISALERHLDDERNRLRSSLADALHAVDEHLTPAPPAPPVSDVEIPPMRVPTAGPLPELDLETLAAFAPLEPPAEVAHADADEGRTTQDDIEIGIAHTVTGPVDPWPAPDVPAASPRVENRGHDVPPAPVFDELAELTDPEPFDAAEPEPVAHTASDLFEPPAPPDAGADQEAPAPGPEGEEDDPFIAELRRAITDTEPLGPREDDDGSAVDHGDQLVHGDVLDSSRLGSLLRRRR